MKRERETEEEVGKNRDRQREEGGREDADISPGITEMSEGSITVSVT